MSGRPEHLPSSGKHGPAARRLVECTGQRLVHRIIAPDRRHGQQHRFRGREVDMAVIDQRLIACRPCVHRNVVGARLSVSGAAQAKRAGTLQAHIRVCEKLAQLTGQVSGADAPPLSDHL